MTTVINMTYKDDVSQQLARYLQYNGPGSTGVNFDMVRSFVNAGADPLVSRYGDGMNLFEIASYNRWKSESWLKLIDICRAGEVTPNWFTKGLAHYLKYQGPGSKDFDCQVVKTFVNAGAKPLVAAMTMV